MKAKTTLHRMTQGIATLASHYSVADTVSRLQTAIATKGMTLFAVIDQAAEARKVGLTMPATTILFFGNPKGGTPIMVAAPLAALDLPLKVLVWEDAARTVWASYATPAYLAARYGIPPELVQNIAGIEPLVAGAVG
jgi:uncharacterized protein (DUF302 family)